MVDVIDLAPVIALRVMREMIAVRSCALLVPFMRQYHQIHIQPTLIWNVVVKEIVIIPLGYANATPDTPVCLVKKPGVSTAVVVMVAVSAYKLLPWIMMGMH